MPRLGVTIRSARTCKSTTVVLCSRCRSADAATLLSCRPLLAIDGSLRCSRGSALPSSAAAKGPATGVAAAVAGAAGAGSSSSSDA